MNDPLAGWLFILGPLIRFLQLLANVKSNRTRRRCRHVRYSHWRIGALERTRFDSIDDSQS
jgi:hypothetical protein